jgi:hypothetical protein
VAFLDVAAQQVRYQLLTVTDAEDRYGSRQNLAVNRRAGGLINAMRSAGDDDTSGGPQLFKFRVAGKNLGRNAEFPDFSSDEMTVLTAGVEYRYL